MNDSYGVGVFVTLLVAIVLTAAFGLGASTSTNNFITSCDDFGKIKLRGIWYECKAKKGE